MKKRGGACMQMLHEHRKAQRSNALMIYPTTISPAIPLS